MTAVPSACPGCGHRQAAEPCSRCHGTLVRLGDGARFQPGRGLAVNDLVRGFLGCFASALHLLHRREFIGRLQLPVAANLVVAGGLLAVTWFWLQPLFAGWLDADWPLLDRATRASGGLWMALATLWWLGPTLLEVALGPILEPLVEIAEQRIGGPGMRVLRSDGLLELRRRARASARILALQLLTLPLAWLLALLPIAGPPLVLLLSSPGAAVAWFAVPLARRQCELQDRLRVLRANWPFALGLGLASQLGWLLPFFNLLFLAPAATVGAAALYFRFDKGKDQG